MQMPSASMCTYTSTLEKRELYLRATVHAQTDTYSYTPTVLSHTNQRHDVDWRWVRGHDGDEGNERADELARRGSAEAAAKT